MMKVKVKAKPRSVNSGSGTVIATAKVTARAAKYPQGRRLFQTRAQIGLRPKTTLYGNPRQGSRH